MSSPSENALEAVRQEGRRSPRVPLRRRVWCEGDRLTLYLQSLNASLGGVFLRTATPLPPGSRATLSVKIDEVEMVADAEVVWVSPPTASVPGMGLKLLSIHAGAEAWASLLAVVAQHPAQ